MVDASGQATNVEVSACQRRQMDSLQAAFTELAAYANWRRSQVVQQEKGDLVPATGFEGRWDLLDEEQKLQWVPQDAKAFLAADLQFANLVTAPSCAGFILQDFSSAQNTMTEPEMMDLRTPPRCSRGLQKQTVEVDSPDSPLEVHSSASEPRNQTQGEREKSADITDASFAFQGMIARNKFKVKVRNKMRPESAKRSCCCTCHVFCTCVLRRAGRFSSKCYFREAARQWATTSSVECMISAVLVSHKQECWCRMQERARSAVQV